MTKLKPNDLSNKSDSKKGITINCKTPVFKRTSLPKHLARKPSPLSQTKGSGPTETPKKNVQHAKLDSETLEQNFLPEKHHQLPEIIDTSPILSLNLERKWDIIAKRRRYLELEKKSRKRQKKTREYCMIHQLSEEEEQEEKQEEQGQETEEEEKEVEGQEEEQEEEEEQE
ncbi:hypothetical protein J3Q64DRAFT_1738045, partial [Phycomyces blakesleeanus]